MKVDWKQLGTYSRLVFFIILSTLKQEKLRNEKKILGIMCILVSTILIACNTSAQEFDLSGAWKGTCFNQTYQMETDIEAFMVHKGLEVRGDLKVYPPLYGSGPLEAKYDLEKEKFSAKVKCKDLVTKLLYGGGTIYFEGVINAIPAKERGQVIGEMRGTYRFDPRWWKDQIGIFSITKKMQINESLNLTFGNVSPVFTTKDSNIFHKPDCPKLGTEYFIEFDSSQQAYEAGGVPCENCNP